jgi:hypothetical protein
MNNIIVNQEITKTQFIEDIKKWVTIDNQMKIVNEKTKKLREYKHKLNDEICSYIKNNNMTNNKIGISDGELGIYDKKEYSSTTYEYIENKLSEIIMDKEQVNYIIQYLKDNREITIVSEIRRKVNK